MDAYDGTTTFYVADTDDPIIRAWSGVFPTLFRRRSASCPPDLAAAPPGARGAVQRPDPDVRPLPRRRSDDVLHATTTSGPIPMGQTNEQSLPSGAYYVVMRMPGANKAGVPPAPADDPERAVRT